MQHIEVLDFDEVLNPSDIVADYMAWLVPLVQKEGFAQTNAEAEQLIMSTFHACGSAAQGIAQAFKREKAWVESIYAQAGTHLMPLVAQRCGPNAGLIDALRTHQSRGHVLAIATQSHGETYLNPLLQHLGLAEIFPPHLRFGRVYKRLSESYTPIAQKLEQLYPGRPWHMADDSQPNLPPAKQAGARQTIWIHPDEPATALPAGIDTHFPTLEAYLRSQH